MGLENKTVIVTGGGSGIGRETALAFAKEGCNILIGDIDLDAARKVVGEIQEKEQAARAVQVDVSSESDVDLMVQTALEEFKKVDVLINNAGITQLPQSILDLPLESFQRVTDIDYKGVYLCSRRVGKEMIGQREGCVINISSIAGLVSLPLVVYGPAKSAIIMLTKILATEWGRYNVRVNAIAPGYTLTPLLKNMIERGERDPKKLIERTPMGNLIEPVDIANAAIFLASAKARYITGVTLPVDGGFVADGGWEAYGGYER